MLSPLRPSVRVTVYLRPHWPLSFLPWLFDSYKCKNRQKAFVWCSPRCCERCLGMLFPWNIRLFTATPCRVRLRSDCSWQNPFFNSPWRSVFILTLSTRPKCQGGSWHLVLRNPQVLPECFQHWNGCTVLILLKWGSDMELSTVRKQGNSWPLLAPEFYNHRLQEYVIKKCGESINLAAW